MLKSFLPQKVVSLLCWCVLASGDYQDWLEYPLVTPPTPIRIMQPAGKEIRLQCWNKSRQGVIQEDCCKFHEIVWQYKKCETDHSFSSCQSSNIGLWTTLCGNSSNPCQSTLTLSTPTEKNSGLYQCSVSHRNKTSRNLKVTQTYEVEIIDLKGAPPEFLYNQPSNVTVSAGDAAVFQCRVRSKVPPNFFWFRQQNNSTNGSYIKYLNDTYEPMKSSGERELSKDIHLSKLILPHSSQIDSGYYLCVAINGGGFQYKAAYLTVLASAPTNQNVSSSPHASSLLLPFFIPAALALVPLVVWACFPWKQCCTKKLITNQDSIPIFESSHHNNNSLLQHPQSKVTDFKYKNVNVVIQCTSNECTRDYNHDKNCV